MNIKTLALSTIIGLTSVFGGVSEAEARPTRLVGTTTDNGTFISFKPVGRHGVNVLVNNQYSGRGFMANMNCATGDYQWNNNTGFNEGQIRNILVEACNF